jgi:hypothetical protein
MSPPTSWSGLTFFQPMTTSLTAPAALSSMAVQKLLE